MSKPKKRAPDLLDQTQPEQKPTKTRAKAKPITQAPAAQLPAVTKPKAPAAIPKPLQGLPATDAAAGLLGLVERLAENPHVDVAKMQAILDMQMVLWKRAAEIAYNQSFGLMSQSLPRVIKTGAVQYEKEKGNKAAGMLEAFKFAPFEKIDEVVRPLIHQFGFSIDHTTELREGGGIIMVSTLSHKDGHSKVCKLPLALDSSGGKNNLQAMGSTTSYGRRYGTQILLNLITVGEDTDGNPPEKEPEVMDTERAVELDKLLRERELLVSEAARPNVRPRFLAHFQVESLQALKESDYTAAKTAIMAIGSKPQPKK